MTTGLHRLFRQHHVAPTLRSQLYQHLLTEWVSLNSSPAVADAIRGWSCRHPVLAGLETPGEIVDAIDAAQPATADAMLLALIDLLQSGDGLAGRVCLQAMMPMVSRTARSVHHREGVEAARHAAVGGFWETMCRYPVARRRTSVAANLKLETLRRLTVDRVSDHDPEVVASLDHLDWRQPAIRDQLSTSPLGSHGPLGDLVDADLPAVLSWAVAHQVITADEAHMMQQVYTEHGFRFEQVADDLGISQAALRQRCSRTKKVLAQAVRRELVDA